MTQEDKARYEQLVSASPAEQVSIIQGMDEEKQMQFKHFRINLEIKPRIEESKALTEPLMASEVEMIKQLIPRGMDESSKTRLRSKALMLQQTGAFFGMYFFVIAASRIGRRATFLGLMIMGWISVVLVFLTFKDASQIWYLWPFLGFATLAPFGGYAVYLPELFPTRLRSTGISFCYNVGRFITAGGVLILGSLAVALDGKTAFAGFRIAAVLIATSYIIGIVALIWAPETVNKPLPEED
jgi:MFS family permease